MLAGLFAVGTLWFWALLTVSTGFLFLCMDREWGVGAALNIALVLFLLEKFGNLGLVSFMLANPAVAIPAAGIYVLLGVLWSIARWYLLMKDKRQEYNEKVEDALENWSPDPALTDEENAKARKERIKSKLRHHFRIPKANQNKARIMRWMAFWPWNAVWHLLDDFVRRGFEYIYMHLAGIYQRISDSVFGDIEEELK